MAGLAALYGAQPGAGTLKALYQDDPRYALAQQAIQSGTSTAPAQGGWGEALARAFQGTLGGYMSGQIKNDADSKEQGKAQTMADAMALGRDQPAQTQQYGDGTKIDWNARPGSTDNMVSALMSNPDTSSVGMGLQGAMMDNKMATDQELAKLKLANDLKGSEPITPYQQADLKQKQDKIDAGGGGISYTMPDGTEIQIGGSGKGAGGMKEYQAAASSRAQLLGDGLKTLENNISDPSVSPLRMAIGDTMKGTALGDLGATKLQGDKENIASAGRDAALEGMASAVTGAGVTKDQFTRFTNMLPKAADTQPVKDAKFDNAYNFLLNQTNVAGPIAEQLKQHIVERNQARQQVGAPGAAGATTPTVIPTAKGQFNAAAAKQAGYTDAEIQQFLQGQQ